MKRERRPVVKLKLKRIDVILEGIALACLITLWVYTFLSYSSLPEQIPAHYNVQGDIDKYEGKQGLWKLPITITIIYVVITVLNRFPEIFNYPVEITAENAHSNYSSATTMLRVLNCICIFIFMVIVFSSTSGINIVFLIVPLVLSLFLLPVIFLFKSKGD